MNSLTEKDILSIVETWNESEDERELESDYELDVNRQIFEYDDSLVDIDNLPEVKDETENIRNMSSTSSNFIDPKTVAKDLKKKYSKVLWKQKEFLNKTYQLCFNGNTTLPNGLLNLETPYHFFKYFWTDELLEHIIQQTILYSSQLDPAHPFKINKAEISQYIGICILSSVIHICDTRKYWSPVIGNKLVQETMTLNHFEKIRRFIHFNDNNKMLPKNNSQHDRLFKIRPLITHLLAKCQSVPYEECMSIDEQLCTTKGKSYLKQYLPDKPHKWGYKLFVLSGVSGFSYNFEIYTAQENDPTKRLSNEPDLGCSANIVIRLLRGVPKYENYRIYFDNYYTTLPLLVELAKNGIHTVGTVRRNRLPNCKLPTEMELKKEKRGTVVEYVTSIDQIDIVTVSWKDNKLVNLISTFTGKNPMKTIQRFDKQINEMVTLDCPDIVKEYNRFMGGVDKTNSLIGRYKIKMKSRKWYIRIFYHLLDVSLVNAWVLCKRASIEREMEDTLPLLDFRLQVAETLCKIGTATITTRKGRPSKMENTTEVKRQRISATHYPSTDIRLDNYAHWPVWTAERQRCKNPTCSSLTFVICDKCKINLCFQKNRNCYKEFHLNK